ncbi:MAG: solute:Na+ symporter SSS family [Spirochaetes bacterium]|nr:MAG: solute:Na+ symporter SSS family [Spirochaetota bacterium]
MTLSPRLGRVRDKIPIVPRAMPGLSQGHPGRAPGVAMQTGPAVLPGIAALALYALFLLLIGFRRGSHGTEGDRGSLRAPSLEEFFLRGRSLSWLPLFLTLAATNFSAFTVLGLAGAGYRMGYAFYPAMAFGTGFMALGMYLVGSPLREEGVARGWLSAVDAVRDRLGSAAAARVFAFFLIVFTLPYLALQPIAAGYLLETAFGVPYRAGALGVAVLIALYTARGGLKSLAKTDAFNGIILFGIALAAWILVRRAAPASGGHSQAGAAGSMPPFELLGYYLLWFMADPMFPQLGQRFLAASGKGALERSAAAYPLVTTSLFFLTIAVGVLGRGLMPGLSGAEADKVWLLAAAKAAGPALSGIFVLAPLAALVSTMDSQLLALASIIVKETKMPAARAAPLVFSIAAISAVLALFPPTDILSFLNKASFLGYAALFPTLFGVLYSKKARAAGALSSMIAGEAAVFLLGSGLWSAGMVPAIFFPDSRRAGWGRFYPCDGLSYSPRFCPALFWQALFRGAIRCGCHGALARASPSPYPSFSIFGVGRLEKGWELTKKWVLA